MPNNEPVGARARRAFRRMGEFFTTTEGERPQAGGAYTMTAEEERAEAQRTMQELQARRAARAAERAAAPSRITNRPVGGNLAAAQPSRRMDLPTGPEMDVMLPRSVGPDNMAMDRPPPAPAPAPAPARQRTAARPRPRPRAAAPRQSEADRLNEISLAFARGERPRGGAADNIGRALGIEGYKKGGLVGAKKPVKRAMGGSIPKPPAPPKPKVPGRKAGRPATAVKVPPRKAPTAPKMPAFKKGGKVSMKGKRK